MIGATLIERAEKAGWTRKTKSSSAEANTSMLKSMIVPLLFEGLSKVNGLTVLDIGPARSETVAFFSQYKCKVIFADLLAEIPPDQMGPEVDADLLRDRFHQLLSDATDDQFDLCLFWDRLNYLDDYSLELFDDALSPLIDFHARGHGLGVRTSEVTMPYADYGIHSLEQLAVKTASDRHHDYHPHTPADHKRLFSSMAIARGTLLRDGRIEFLFSAS